MTQSQSKFLALALSIFLVLISGFSARADGLGISVSIVPYTDESGLGGGNDKLWFPIEPGQTLNREIEVTSQSDLRQVVYVQAFDYITEDGVRSTDFSQPSVISEWLSQEAIEGVVLEPRESVTIPITLSVPSDAVQRAYEGKVRVIATEVDEEQEEDQGGGVKAIVKGAVAIDLAFWVGVGDVLTLLPSFDIADLEGVLIGDSKFIRIYFDNTGLSPLRLRGSAQFSDPQFVERVFDPVSFVSPEIPPGESGFAEVLIDQEITEGNWNVFVVAEQDGIRQTRLFEGNIRFVEPGALPAWVGLAAQIAIGLLSLVGAMVGLRAIRSTRNRNDEAEPSELDMEAKATALRPKLNLKLPTVDLTGLVDPVKALWANLIAKAKEGADRPRLEKPDRVIQKPERSKAQKPVRTKVQRASKSAKSYEARVQALMNANQVVRDLMGEDIRDSLFQAEMAEKYPQGNYSFDFDTLEKSAQDRVRKILDAKRVIRELQTDELRIEVIRRETDAKLERMRQATGV